MHIVQSLRPKHVPIKTFSKQYEFRPLALVGAAQIFFGSMLMFGKFVHSGSLVLAVVTILINLYIHDFWNMSDNPDQAHETQNFVKNLGILAGLLVLSRNKN